MIDESAGRHSFHKLLFLRTTNAQVSQLPTVGLTHPPAALGVSDAAACWSFSSSRVLGADAAVECWSRCFSFGLRSRAMRTPWPPSADALEWPLHTDLLSRRLGRDWAPLQLSYSPSPCHSPTIVINALLAHHFYVSFALGFSQARGLREPHPLHCFGGRLRTCCTSPSTLAMSKSKTAGGRRRVGVLRPQVRGVFFGAAT